MESKAVVTSDSIASLVKAMVAFSLECPTIHKEVDNDVYRSKYADLASILRVVKPVLGKHGLAVSQFPVAGGDGTISLVTQLAHESGEFMRATYTMKLAEEIIRYETDQATKIRTPVYGLTSQAVGKGITYAMRYGIGAVLNLQIDEDDDGNSTSGKTHEDPKSNTKPQPPKTTQQSSSQSPSQAAKPAASATPSSTIVKLTPEKIEGIKTAIAAMEVDKAETFEQRLTALGVRQEISKEVWGELTEMFLKRLVDVSEKTPPVLAAIANKIPALAGIGVLDEARRKTITEHIKASAAS